MLYLDDPATAAVPLSGRGRLRAQADFCTFVADRSYLSFPSALAFAEWLVTAWHDFVEGDRSLTVGYVLHSALIDWCGGTDPTRCINLHPMGGCGPSCTGEPAAPVWAPGPVPTKPHRGDQPKGEL